MNTTVKRYPRSLNEAFPGTAEYGCAVEHFKPTKSSLGGMFAAAAVIALAVMATAVALA